MEQRRKKRVKTFIKFELCASLHLSVLPDPVQIVDHLGIDPWLVSPATAVAPGDDALQCLPLPAGADHGTSTVSLTTNIQSLHI